MVGCDLATAATGTAAYDRISLSQTVNNVNGDSAVSASVSDW